MGDSSLAQPDLGSLIRAEIAAHGPLTFARFMELALYHPTLGYYAGGGSGREPVGWGGDFFTAGDLTPLWGRALARRFARLWELMGRPERFDVVEAGAGRGLLAAAVWGYAIEQASAWAHALRYTLVDRAPVGSPLQAAREARLAQALASAGAPPDALPPDAIRWADTLANAAPPRSLVGCVFANELADALPTHIVKKQGDALAEVYVALDANGQFVMQAGSPSTPAVADYLDHYRVPWRRYPNGWRAEVCLLAPQWMASAARLLARGCVMTLDYGDTARRLYTPARLAGTLMAYTQHRVAADPLAHPGQQDFTAHVNFSALIEGGRAAGLRLAEDTTQGALLERLGIWDAADALATHRYPHADDRQTAQGQLDYLRRASLRNAVKALLAPQGLGGFRALTMQRGLPGLGVALSLPSPTGGRIVRRDGWRGAGGGGPRPTTTPTPGGHMQPPPDLTITPPAADRLGALTTTAPVVRDAQLVWLDGAAIAALAARWAAAPWPAADADFGALHFADGTERTANWALLLDALNFCFWADAGRPRWRVDWRGETLDGYNALAAALTQAVAAGRPLWDARYLATLDAATLRDILRPADGCPEIPLFVERLANAREVGAMLLARYDGQFARAVASVEGDAVALALLLARDFPSFADVASWRGQRVVFLKRAQICAADLHALFQGQGIGALTGLADLTAFADYKLPQLLRRFGALVYAPELAALVDGYTHLSPGSEAEVEIRAATIWAVELLRRALAAHGVIQTASAIDYRLWAESQTHLPDDRPYHRTRTIYY